jgi:hypothetical protein
VPTARRLGEDAAPLQLLFQKVGIAEVDAVARAKFDQEAVAFALREEHDQKVLKKLGV